MVSSSLSAKSAKLIAIRSLGLATPAAEKPSHGSIGHGRLHSAIRGLGILQIDTVNVFARAHYMPLFSRLGGYETTILDRSNASHSGVFEFWAHEAGFVPKESWPLWQWRMRQHEANQRNRFNTWASQNRQIIEWLYDYVAANGPTAAGEIEHERNRATGSWWGWSDVKRGLEWLFWVGRLTSAERDNFRRRYALPQQVIPASLLSHEVSDHEAKVELVRTASRALGVATLKDTADYFRMSTQETRTALDELIDRQEVRQVSVEGWKEPAYLSSTARRPRSVSARALLSPFDPLVWHRPRTERIFDFHYRLEIYTPEPQRKFGYYTLPFLLGSDIVGRVDLKSDRKRGSLLVKAAWSEPGAPEDTAEQLAETLAEAARWQGLTLIEVEPRGNLAPALSRYFS